MQIYNHMFQDQFPQKGVLQSSVLRIQNLELSLQRAIEDISLLQKNLSYVIQIKEQLQQQVKVREKREETIIKEFQRELNKKEREIEVLRSDREEIAELLSDTKDQINTREATIMQREEERRRFQRIIEDQRSTIQVLEEQLLAAKYNSDLSYQSISFDNIKIQQIEKENDTLRLELGKIKSAFQRQVQKCRKADKEVEGFKNWLGSVMGVRKVVEGCEQILMQQIENRLSNYGKY